VSPAEPSAPLAASALVRRLELRSLVGLTVAAAWRNGLTQEVLLGLVISEWRALAALEARVEAAAAATRVVSRRALKREGR
jgi:hypothetical protein